MFQLKGKGDLSIPASGQPIPFVGTQYLASQTWHERERQRQIQRDRETEMKVERQAISDSAITPFRIIELDILTSVCIAYVHACIVFAGIPAYNGKTDRCLLCLGVEYCLPVCLLSELEFGPLVV